MIQALLACALLAAAPNEKATAALEQAIRRGKTEDVLQAIAAGADVNGVWTGSKVPLLSHAASLRDPKARLAIVKALLDAGARADVEASEYHSPIPAPVRDNDLDVVKLLLAHKAKPDVRGSGGSTPLLWAIERGPAYREMVDVLLAAGADPRTKERDAGANGFVLAAGADHTALLARLEAQTNLAVTGPLALERAADRHATDAIRWLLDKRVTPTLPRTLERAVSVRFECDARAIEGARKTIEALKAGGVDVSGAPLADACLCKSEALYAYLRSVGAHPKRDPAALVAVAQEGDVAWLKRLLDDGAPPSVDALHGAIARAKPQAAALLVERGASLTAADADGLTAVHVTARKGADETLAWVLAKIPEAERRAALNAPHRFGDTPLHFAVEGAVEDGAASRVKLLLAAGADAGLKDGDGKTPRERALDDAKMSIVALFDSHAGAPAVKGTSGIALITGGGTKREDAEAALLRWAEDQKLIARVLAPLPGSPKIVRSDDVKGLKPGFFVTILGVCEPEEGARVLAILKALDAGIYARPVESTERSCPVRDPSVSQDGSWSVQKKSVRLTVSEVHKGKSTELLVVHRGAGGKLLGGFWTDGRGPYEHGNASGDCEMEVEARGARIVVTRACTNVNAHMCSYEDHTETGTLSISSGELVVTSVTDPEHPTATACGE